MYKFGERFTCSVYGGVTSFTLKCALSLSEICTVRTTERGSVKALFVAGLFPAICLHSSYTYIRCVYAVVRLNERRIGMQTVKHKQLNEFVRIHKELYNHMCIYIYSFSYMHGYKLHKYDV